MNNAKTPQKPYAKSKAGFRPRRRRFGGPRLLSSMVERMTKPIFGKRGFAHATVVNQWPDIVGAEMAALSAPEKIVFSKDGASGGILHLRTVTGGLATEIQHLEPLILERINQHFGYNAVIGLRMTQGPLPPRDDGPPPEPRRLSAKEEEHLSESLSNVDDPEIREALARLGRSIAARRSEEP